MFPLHPAFRHIGMLVNITWLLGIEFCTPTIKHIKQVGLQQYNTHQSNIHSYVRVRFCTNVWCLRYPIELSYTCIVWKQKYVWQRVKYTECSFYTSIRKKKHDFYIAHHICIEELNRICVKITSKAGFIYLYVYCTSISLEFRQSIARYS